MAGEKDVPNDPNNYLERIYNPRLGMGRQPSTKPGQEPEVDYRPLMQAYQNYKDLSDGKGPSYQVMSDVRKNQDITQYNATKMIPNADQLLAAAEKANIPASAIEEVRAWINQSKKQGEQTQTGGDRTSPAEAIYGNP